MKPPDHNATLSAYEALRERMNDKLRLPAMHAGGHRLVTMPFDAPDRLWNALLEQAPTQGWLQFQSLQCAFPDGLPKPEANWGLLLAAEAVNSQGDSLIVGRDGHGAWLLSRCIHGPEQPGLWDEVHHLAHNPDTGTLRYRRYWRLDPEQGYVQTRACFIGFESE